MSDSPDDGDEQDERAEQCDCGPHFECDCNPTKERVGDGRLYCKNCWATLRRLCDYHEKLLRQTND